MDRFETPPADDDRLYVPYPEGWTAHIKVGWEKMYCYYKLPDQDFHHLILNGEIYLQRADEKICLQCALRREILTRDRLYWQRRARKAPPSVL
ncbi:MAG: hypothetical protein ACF8TS_16050 [Maioricimonas sp. JB049]